MELPQDSVRIFASGAKQKPNEWTASVRSGGAGQRKSPAGDFRVFQKSSERLLLDRNCDYVRNMYMSPFPQSVNFDI